MYAAILLAFLWLPGPSCTNSDNFALLGGTLKIMQRAACDDEMVALACPTSTTISIQVAQYGKATPQGHACVSERAESQAIDVEVTGSENCLWPNPMQYSLLQTVVEACQKKPSCKFSTKPKPGLTDPCPFARKFVEVAYRCRPYEFRSRTACENDTIQLSCNPFRRVAVFDAQYGRTAYESVTCPQGAPDGETCMAQYAAEKVMKICHGKRRCTIAASSKTFGTPCKTDSRPYLKIIYACVPLGVLSEKYESAAEKDEMDHDRNESSQSFDESGDAGEKWSEPNAMSPVADPALQPLPNEDATPPPKADLPTLLHPPMMEKTPVPNATNIDSEQVKSVVPAILYAILRSKSDVQTILEENATLTPKADLAALLHTTMKEKTSVPNESNKNSKPVTKTDMLNAIYQAIDTNLPPLPDEDATPPTKIDLTSLFQTPVKEKTSEHPKRTLFIYIGVGLAVFIILIILLIGVRCYIIRKTSRESKTGDMFTTEAPNVFNDAVSDIDNDIDVAHISGTFYDPIHPDMILYRDVPGAKGTLRAMRPLSTIYPCAGASMYGNVDFVPSSRELPARFSKEEDANDTMTSPKSLDRTYSSSQFYYG